MQWSVASFRQKMLVISAGADFTAGDEAPRYFLRAELDVNTAPEQMTPLPQERLPDLFDELVASATEIVREGDIQ
jgi:hypothetical protein